MKIPTLEGTFEYNLKQAITRMLINDPQFQGMKLNDIIYHLDSS